MEITTEYLDRFVKEEIYLWNDTEEVYVKSLPTGNYFAKFKGKPEYKISHDTDIVTMAISGMQEVTKEEYENS